MSDASHDDFTVIKKSADDLPLAGTPLEVQITRQALQKRLDEGDITRQDLEAFKKSYRWVPIWTGLGAATSIPAFMTLGKRGGPGGPAPTSVRLAGALLMGLSGGLLGYAVGEIAATNSVKRNVVDPIRKARVLAEISYDASRAITEHRMGIPVGTVICHVAGVPVQTKYYASKATDPMGNVVLAPLATGSVASYQDEQAAMERQRKVFEGLVKRKEG